MKRKTSDVIERSRRTSAPRRPTSYDGAVFRLATTAAVVLVLVGAPTSVPAMADDGGTTWSNDPDEAAAVIVDAHQTYLTVKGPQVRGTQSWTISVVDPARAGAVRAPAGLEGAKARGAEISGGRVVLPPGLPPGTSLTFEANIDERSAVFAPSGAFRTAPGLPTSRAELVIKSVRGPLAVWADPGGAPTWSRGASPQAIVVWRDLPADAVGEAVWSTGTDWLAAGRRLDRLVEPLLTTNLGRELGGDLSTATPAILAERVFAEIALDPAPTDGWSGRAAPAVIASRRGSAAERGLVLISALRKAGFEARPGLYRPSALRGTVPTSLPAPSLLSRPVIAVTRDAGVEWIDPSATFVVPPTLPVDLTGAAAWVSGDLPRRIESTGTTEGAVPISGEIKLEAGGGQSFVLNLSASGTADEWLRTALVAMSDAERDERFRAIAATGRPELDRLTVTVTGEQDRSKPLRVTIRGHVGPRGEALSAGVLRHQVPALLAPGLAAWLPPQIAVHEEVAITPPPGARLFTVAHNTIPSDPGAVVTARTRREAERLVLVSDVERPHRHLAPAAANRAAATLERATRSGPHIYYIAAATPATARGLRSANLEAADRVSLEALLWWRQSKYAKARKLLDKYLGPVTLAELDAALERHQAPYELRRALVDLPRNDADKLASLPILLAAERRKDAWLRAVEISESRDPNIQVESRLWMLQLQPETHPGGAEDPQGALLWREPAALVSEAARIHKAANGGAVGPEILAAQARLAMKADDATTASSLLAKATAQSTEPALLVAYAHASAAAGAPMDDVQALLDRAVAQAPSDGALLAEVADTFAATGHRVDALGRALGAARVSGGEAAVWSGVVERALDAGELATALFAARKASDLALSNTEYASVLTRVATLAGDPTQANLGWTRGGTPLEVSWPPAMQELTALVEPPHLLAVLRHHDAAVIQDPGLLSLRAQLELAAGSRPRAVRDGVLLTQRHGMARGRVVAFGAALGDTWGSGEQRVLDELVRLDPAARATRLELRALFGGSIGPDAKAMDDDPRAQLWAMALGNPAELAARDASWTNPPVTWGSPPAGYLKNAVLGTVEGVEAWSAPDSRRTVLRHGGADPVPPPLSVLYTPRNPPLRSLPDKGLILVLDDGSFPVYLAARREQQSWVVGLGLTPEEAARALKAAPPL